MVQINTVSISKEIHTKPVRTGIGHLKTTEPTVRGRIEDDMGASQACILSVGQSRREKLPVAEIEKSKQPRQGPVMVPTLSFTGKPLMPCHPARARELIKQGRAVRRWYKGIFAIKLLDRTEGAVQKIVCGIDPGSKREAFTVMSRDHTYLNVLSDAVTYVKDRVETRKGMRRSRRYRKTPCRTPRWNRLKDKKWLPPSIKSRWQIKINIIRFMKKLYPITDFVVEDIKATTLKGSKKWNAHFNPVQHGKNWFYNELIKFGEVIQKQGYQTFEKRRLLNFKKHENKLSETFGSHNVDSWTLCSFITDKTTVDNRSLFRIIPIQWHRRQLHRLEPGVRGYRKDYGGTMSLGLKRGSIVKNKRGLVYVGGFSKKGLSLHNIKNGIRLTQQESVKNCTFLNFNSWKTRWVENRL